MARDVGKAMKGGVGRPWIGVLFIPVQEGADLWLVSWNVYIHLPDYTVSTLQTTVQIAIYFWPHGRNCMWQEKYYEEYRLYELGDLASKLIGPLLKDQLNSWSPLQNPQEPMALFKQWKDILDDGQPQTLTNISTQDPYHQLIWHAWMPSVRTAVTYVT